MNMGRINNGISTLLQNRFGDLFFLIFFFRVIDAGENLKFLLALLLGCVVKRAQFPPNS